MSVVNNKNLKYSKDARQVIKNKVSSATEWTAYRYVRALELGVDAKDFHTGSMSLVELLLACDHLGIDACEVATRAGFAPSVSGAPRLAKPAAVSGVVSTIDGDVNEEDVPDYLRPLMENEAAMVDEEKSETPAAAGETNSFRGRDVEEVIGEALSPVEGLIADRKLAELRALIAPIVEAASKPVVETREVVRLVQASALSVKAATTSTKVAMKPARKVFGFSKSEGGSVWKDALDGASVACYSSPLAPVVDGEYVWTAELAAMLSIADQSGQSILLYGPAGTGKTTAAEQYAALTGRPFMRIAFDRTTEPADLKGGRYPSENGGIEWHDGNLTRAFRVPGMVLLLDEPTLLRSGSLAVLQTALDTRRLVLDTGEVVQAADDLLVVAADNTDMTGDASGRYIDTAPVNLAFSDRFAWRVAVDYLSPAKEIDAVSSQTGLHREATKMMVEYAGKTRSEANGGTLTAPVTMRRLLAWARAVQSGIGSKLAFRFAVLNGADAADVEKLRELERATLESSHKTIDLIREHGGVPATASTTTFRDLAGVERTEINNEADARAANAFANAPTV